MAAYLIGSGRVFGYDSAVTFANFIATPSLLDALAVHSQQPTIPLATIAGNDHVLVSLLSHLVYSLTGTRAEAVYRLLPALAAGGTVGVMAAVLVSRFGSMAGIWAGLYIAADPLFVENSRDLRGYSLAALCAVLATVTLLRLFPPQQREGRGGGGNRLGPASNWRLGLYALLLGLAIAAHLFAGLVLAGHVAWIALRRSWPEWLRVAPAWLAAGVIGLAANANVLWIDLTQRNAFPPSLFDPTFPRELVFYLLGAPVLLTIGLWLSTAGLGLWAERSENRVWASVALVALAVGVLWLVVKPAYLYPRFFVFLIPACAYLIAAAVKRWRVLAPVVLLGAAVAVAFQLPGYTSDSLALREAAAVVDRAQAEGRRACVIHSDEQVLGAYTTHFSAVTSPDQLQACDLVVVVTWGVDLPLRDEAAREFTRRTALAAGYPAVVLER
jgi:uncharacterized membrane protein